MIKYKSIKMKKTIITIVIILASLGVIGFILTKNKAENEAKTAIVAEKNASVSVKVDTVKTEEVSLHTPEEEFTLQILKKLKQTQTSTLQVTVNLEIPYDLSKLRESIELLNLDKGMISTHILHGLNLFNVFLIVRRISLCIKIFVKFISKSIN